METQTVTIAGKRIVLLEEDRFQELCARAGQVNKLSPRLRARPGEPLLPAPDDHGHYPAQEALRVLMARKIIRRRKSLGMSQAALARRAGLRVETVNRIETGKNSPNVRTVGKLERALERAEASARSGRGVRTPARLRR